MKHLSKFFALFTIMLVFSITGCKPEADDSTDSKTEDNKVYYTVTFETDGGSKISAQKITSGDKAKKPSNPRKAVNGTTGYRFVDWYSDSELTVVFDFDTVITADITLYAKWNEVVVYSIKINESENGSITAGNNRKVTANKTSDIEAGERITLTVKLDDPLTYNYTQTLSVKNGENDIALTNNSFTMPAGNVTISAAFEKYVGTKKPSVKKEVKDIVFNDDSAMSYEDFEALDDNVKDAKNKTAIAFIFYKGNTLNSDNTDTSTVRTLGVGFKLGPRGTIWCDETAAAFEQFIPDIFYTTDKNGSDNFEKIADFLNNAHETDNSIVNDTGIKGSETSEEEAAKLYPLFYFAKNYKNEIIGDETKSRIISGSKFEDGWYIPSRDELTEFFMGKLNDTETGKGNFIKCIWEDKAQSTWFCLQTSCTYPDHRSNKKYPSCYMRWEGGNSLYYDYDLKHNKEKYCCCIREFN